MSFSISANTQAILLLTAPLITGQNGVGSGELLTHGEYRRLAQLLREKGRGPSDLLGADSDGLLRESESVVAADRVRRLLDRGFLISQAVERWQSRAIWVTSRADPDYPKRIKNRLKDDSPVVLYGCGDIRLLEAGGLAVVGSRHADQTLIEYGEEVGRQCAQAHKTIVSGGARGIDSAAMSGALEAGGRATAVLSDSLERSVLNRENRNWLVDDQLLLVSPYDPSAGFNVGHAMQRNKLIYALADAALVINADYEKGGTWTGATEQLQKLRFVPVYVRSTGEIGSGLKGLMRMGAIPWPNPEHADEIQSLLELVPSEPITRQPQLSLLSSQCVESLIIDGAENTTIDQPRMPDSDSPAENQEPNNWSARADNPQGLGGETETPGPAEALYGYLRGLLVTLLRTPRSEGEVAKILQISAPQARHWLNRLVDEGTIEKRKKPARFVLKQNTLL